MSSAPVIESKLPPNSETALDENGKIRELAQCVASLKYFMTNYVYLRDENHNRKIQWQAWDYLLDLLDILCTYQEIDIDKARQLGVSWTVTAYGLWKSHFNDIAKNLYISQGEKESWELITKTRFIWRNLPDWMRNPLDNDTRSWLSFKGTDSEINALPSTKKAGSGYNATLVIRDELYNHPEGEENFSYIAPSIDSGGQLINLSAVYGDDMTNHFVVRVSDFYRDSDTVKKVYPSGLELYTNPKQPSRALVFLGWRLRPERLEGMTLDDFYMTRLKPRYTQHQLERQYPERIEDTLKVAVSSNFFETKALDDMGYDVMPPITQDKINTFNGVVRVYKLPISGRKYLLFTDPSDGVGDPFVTGVMDFITGEVVCSATGKEQIDRVAEIHDYLSREYDATNSYEYTGSAGGSMATCLQNFNTPKQAPRRKMDGSIDIGKKGQWVSGEYRIKRIGDLASLGVAKRQIICHDREFIQQAKLVVREGDKPIMSRKQTFDWVMMLAGLWDLQRYVPRGTFQIETYVPRSDGSYAVAGG